MESCLPRFIEHIQTVYSHDGENGLGDQMSEQQEDGIRLIETWVHFYNDNKDQERGGHRMMVLYIFWNKSF